jgi:hypothetical protein
MTISMSLVILFDWEKMNEGERRRKMMICINDLHVKVRK